MPLGRYHVTIRRTRTTVLIPTVLAELLALKLGAEPDTPEAHGTVRQWLQEEIDHDPDAIPGVPVQSVQKVPVLVLR